MDRGKGDDGCLCFIFNFGWFVLHWRLECYLHLALGHLFPHEDLDLLNI